MEKSENKTIKNNTAETILLKDKDWNVIDGEICRVTDFALLALKDGKIPKIGKTKAYASLMLGCPKFPNKIRGFVTNKEDFNHLWEAMRRKGIGKDEEVLIVWSAKRIGLLAKIFHVSSPKMYVMVCRSGSCEKITNPDWLAENKGQASFLEVKPVKEWFPNSED